VLRSVRGMVLLSRYDSPLYRELYADWQVSTCAARGEKSCARTEVLWISAFGAAQHAAEFFYGVMC
jgi:hypothetical protein